MRMALGRWLERMLDLNCPIIGELFGAVEGKSFGGSFTPKGVETPPCALEYVWEWGGGSDDEGSRRRGEERAIRV